MKLLFKTTEELDLEIAKRIRLIRRRKKISQEKLSLISNVSLGSIKYFERTGKISLISLTKIAYALNIEDELNKLFLGIPYNNIDEVINENK
jgi:hypothetical protein